jgi:hypothetical protein
VTAQLECLLDDVLVGKQEMIGAIDAVCDVAQRIIGKLKNGAAAEGPTLLGAAVGNGAATYPPMPAMKRFVDSLARQKGIKPAAGTRRLYRSAAPFSTSTCRRKPTVKRLESSNPNRQVRRSYCTLRRLRRGKASSSPTKQRPIRPPCLRGLIGTGARSGASAVARWATNRRAAAADAACIPANSNPPRVRIISDNPLYKPYEGSGEEVNIIGRIRWFAREM